MSPPFVLVHGAWHAGACWQPLVEELEARGERVVAPDLPCEDPAATLDDYAAAVVDAAAEFDEPVVVVGHSLAGLTIPLIPERRPVAALVFVAAILPAPGRPAGELEMADAFHPDFGALAATHQTAEANGASRWDRDGAVAAFYHDVPADRLDAAVSALRLQQWLPTQQPWPLAGYPDVPMRYLACADDRIMSADWQVRQAKERLGLDAEVIEGSNSPMLARPAELADLLLAPVSRAR